MHGGQIQILVRPVAANLDLFAIVEPAQLGGRRRQEQLQRVQIGQPLRTRAQQLRKDLLQLAELLLVQRQLIPTKVRLVPLALDDLRVELVDHLVLVLVPFQLHLRRRQIRSVVGGKQLFLVGGEKFQLVLDTEEY